MNYEKEFRETQHLLELSANLPEDLDEQLADPLCSEEYKKMAKDWAKTYCKYWNRERAERWSNAVLVPILQQIEDEERQRNEE